MNIHYHTIIAIVDAIKILLEFNYLQNDFRPIEMIETLNWYIRESQTYIQQSSSSRMLHVPRNYVRNTQWYNSETRMQLAEVQ